MTPPLNDERRRDRQPGHAAPIDDAARAGVTSITDRVQLRKALLANGYRPLPLQSKGIFIKGWSREEITEAWLDRFARHARYLNTGIRCDDLAAIDIDVLDETLAAEIEGVIKAALGATGLCRIGRYPKRLLLYRLEGDGPFRATRTGRYSEHGHMVELLTGRGRQFAAFGKHPSGVDYQWTGDSPLTVKHRSLRPVAYETCLELIDSLDRLFVARGFERNSPRLSAAHSDGQKWDFTDETPVEVGGERTTWGALKPMLTFEGVFGNLVRENGEFGDSNGVHFYLAQGSKHPCAHDFVRDCTHWDELPIRALADILPVHPSNIDGMFIPQDQAGGTKVEAASATVRIELAAFEPGELLATLEPERYLLAELVPTESYTLIAGALSSFKTTLLHNLLLAKATGHDALGMCDGFAVEPGPCVLVNYEDSDARIFRRFKLLVQHQRGEIAQGTGQPRG